MCVSCTVSLYTFEIDKWKITIHIRLSECKGMKHFTAIRRDFNPSLLNRSILNQVAYETSTE